MKKDVFVDAVNEIDPEYISSAAEARSNVIRKRTFVKWVAVAACVCLVVTGVLNLPGFFNRNVPDETKPGGTSSPAAEFVPPQLGFLSFNAEYPTEVQYPDESAFGDDYEALNAAYDRYYEARRLKNQLPTGYSENASAFYNRIVREMLSSDTGDNAAIAPVNIYMALSMVAELTDGNSRKQILDLLGLNTIDSVRKYASAVWNSSYTDDGTGKLVLANSLWLNDEFKYKPAPFETLKKNYYASSFSGVMGSDEMNKSITSWLNAQTGGFLKDSVSNIKTTPGTFMTLLSTVLFKAEWSSKFAVEDTKPGTFHGVKGDSVCDFMHQKLDSSEYFIGDGFTCVRMEFTSGGYMWMILPDKNSSVNSLIKNGTAIDFVLGGVESAKTKTAKINLSMPKFDITSEFDLTETFNKLGVSDIMSAERSDFSPVTDDRVYLNKATHASRVIVDEEGCTAAAFTSMYFCGTGMPKDEVDFTLDRPFIYVVTSPNGLPQFVGTVNSFD